VTVFLHEHDQRQVGLNVGLRQNPAPQIELKDCWPTVDLGHDTKRATIEQVDDSVASPSKAPSKHAMQRSALC